MVDRSGTTTTYELHINPAALPSAVFQANTTIGFSFLVNDDDGTGRTGWLQWTDGIGLEKAPYYFGELYLLAEGATPGTDMGPGPGADMGPGANNVSANNANNSVNAEPGPDAGGMPGPAAPGDDGCCRTLPGRTPAPAALVIVGLLAAATLRRLQGVSTSSSHSTSAGGVS
jgi:hypothetical protein